MNKKYVAAVCVLWGVIETGFARSPAAETRASVSKNSAPQATLPGCINSDSDIAKIKDIQKTNSKTSHKYDGYRHILQAATADELAARLVYAETLAANCSNHEDQIVDLIAAVVGNRVRIRGGDVKGVVFQKNQFASSLNIYSESRYRDFLCPNDSALWSKVLTKIRANLQESQPSTPIPQDTVNYYLYRHSDRLKAPAWKLEEVPIEDDSTRECIRVFRDPRWK